MGDIKYWLELNAERKQRLLFEGDDGQIWVTKGRGDYITRVGMEDKVKFLSDYGLSLVESSWEAGHPINIGFSEKEQKWYGWSHRAIYGFAIGSQVQKGDCGYQPKDREDFLDSILSFWRDDTIHHATSAEHTEQDGKKGVLVSWVYNEEVPNHKIRGKVSSIFTPYPEHYGRGSWKAKTLDDARQMAIDFAEGVA